jgi:hypothetical protein
MKKIIDLRQKAAARTEGVELSAKCSNYHAVKAMKRVAQPFRSETIWTNKLK